MKKSVGLKKKFPTISTSECSWHYQTYFSAKQDKIFIRMLRQERGYEAKKYVKEFPNRNLSLSSLNDLLKKIAQTSTVDHKTRQNAVDVRSTLLQMSV